MAGSEESKSRWEAETPVELEGITVEQVWPLLEDFCNIHKLIPIETCFQIEGAYGQPGLIRYCAMTTKNDEGTILINWAKEKLLIMDPIKRCFTYEVVDSNMGFKSYVATIKVLPITKGDTPKPTSCKIEWSFACDPMELLTFEGFFSLIHSFNQSMAKNIELAVSRDKSVRVN